MNLRARGGPGPGARQAGQATILKYRISTNPLASRSARIRSLAPGCPTAPRMYSRIPGLRSSGCTTGAPWIRFPILYEAKYHKKLAFKEEPFPEGSEPFGLKPFDFTADRLSRLVRKAIEQEQISISRAAEIMNLSTEQMMNLASEWEAYA